MARKVVSKQSFIEWLVTKYGKTISVSDTISFLDYVNAAYSRFSKETFNIWETTDRHVIDRLIQLTAQGYLGIYRVPLGKIKESLILFKKFLIYVDISNSTTHLEWRTCTNVDDEDDFRERLDTATEFLMNKYKNNHATTVYELQNENNQISFSCFNRWTKCLYDMTAAEYLRKKGVLRRKNYRKERSHSQAQNETVALKKDGNPNRRTNDEIPEEHREIPMSEIKQLIKSEFGNSIQEYIDKQKTISELSTTSSNDTKVSIEQPSWDIYETALMVDQCYRVLFRGISQKETVRRLVSLMRERAVQKDLPEDSLLFNENAISIQLAMIKYLVTDGEDGIPGADLICQEVVAMKKNDPKLFNQILNVVLNQLEINNLRFEDENKIVSGEPIPIFEKRPVELNPRKIADRRKDFVQWANRRAEYRNRKIDPVVTAIENGSKYVLSNKIYPVSFWEIDSSEEFKDVSENLLMIKAFKVKIGKFINAYKSAFELYFQYLKKVERQGEAHVDK